MKHEEFIVRQMSKKHSANFIFQNIYHGTEFGLYNWLNTCLVFLELCIFRIASCGLSASIKKLTMFEATFVILKSLLLFVAVSAVSRRYGRI